MKKYKTNRIPHHIDAILPENGEFVMFKPIGKATTRQGIFETMKSVTVNGPIGKFTCDFEGKSYYVFSKKSPIATEVAVWWRITGEYKAKEIAEKAYKAKEISTEELVEEAKASQRFEILDKVKGISSTLADFCSFCLLLFVVSCTTTKKSNTFNHDQVVNEDGVHNIVFVDTICYGDDRFHDCNELVNVIRRVTNNGDTLYSSYLRPCPDRKYRNVSPK